MKTTIWQPLRSNGVRDKTWTVRLTTAAGKTETRGGFDTKQEANAAAILLTAAIERGESVTDLLRRRSHDPIADLLKGYKAAGCPMSSGRPRKPKAQAAQITHIDGPLQWWADRTAHTLTDADREDYWQHRRATVKKGTGDRSTELELQTLNDALHWAWRRGDLRELPRSMRARFRDTADITHARDAMPANATELHALAGWLFENRPPVYGWLVLFKSMTGLRDEEVRGLLANPQRIDHTYPPGFADAQFLRVHRAKSGCNPRIALDDPQRPHLRPLLDMIRAWKATTAPENEYLFPAPDGIRSAPQGGQLTDFLQDAAKALGLPPRRGHSLRAYYASVRLAQGQTPETVARELGQRSGANLVRDIYGCDADEFDATHWTSLADRFTWLPPAGTPPAWSWWTAAAPSNIIAL